MFLVIAGSSGEETPRTALGLCVLMAIGLTRIHGFDGAHEYETARQSTIGQLLMPSTMGDGRVEQRLTRPTPKDGWKVQE